MTTKIITAANIEAVLGTDPRTLPCSSPAVREHLSLGRKALRKASQLEHACWNPGRKPVAKIQSLREEAEYHARRAIELS